VPVINSEFSVVVSGTDGLGSVIIDYLCNRFTYHSREEWIGLIQKNLIKINENYSRENDTVKTGDRITFYVREYNEPHVPTNYKVMLDLNNVMFVHKPSGLPVMKTGKIFINTLINLIRRDLKNPNIFLLNRLDRETSGIVICVNGKESLKKYSFQNSNNKWQKMYAAVVRGELDRRGVISQSLAEKSDSAIRCQMYPDSNGKYALSFYEVLEQKRGESLIVVVPVTGRKHQIRAHLAYRRASLVGDRIYSCGGKYYLKRLRTELDEKDVAALGAPHHLLHCFHTSFSDNENNHMESLDWELDIFFSKYFACEKIKNWYYSPLKNEFIKWVNDSARIFRDQGNIF